MRTMFYFSYAICGFMVFGINICLQTAKNIALAGVKTVTLHDVGNVEM
jgi:hypothetical protein